jgi:catechol 2,3-dioxygenase-like lactoylglutathione lyase family enzyme
MLGKYEAAATIPVRDLSRARQWYSEKLGFEPEEVEPEGITYRSGCGVFSLYPSEFTGTAKHTLMGWRTDDLEREMSEMRAKGIRFEEYDMPGMKTVNGIAQMGKDRGAWFKDQDGNILAILEEKH